MRLLFLPAIIVLLIHSAFAQQTFVPGYILKSSGDTLRAEILDTQRNNFNTVTYRESGSAQETVLNAGQAGGYGINGGRKFISVSSTPLSADQPGFYELLVIGKAKLLMMDSHFALEMNNTYYELKSTVKEENIGNKIYVRETFTSRGLLTFLFQDCKAVKNDLQLVTLSENDLKKIVTKYNDCFGGSEKLDNAKNDKPPFGKRIAVGLYGGMMFQRYSFENVSNSGYYWFLDQHPVSNNVVLGIFGRYTFNEKWWAMIGISSYSTSLAFSSDRVSGSERKHNDASYSSSNINFDLTARYSFTEKGLVPYVFGGFSFMLTSDESSYRDLTIYTTIGQSTAVQGPSHYEPIYNHAFSLGFTVGAGVQWKSDSKWTPFIDAKFSSLTGEDNHGSGVNMLKNTIGIQAGVGFSL